MATTSQDCATYQILEVARKLGISKSLAYEEARSGRIAGIRVIRIGGRYAVPRKPLDAILNGEVLKNDGGEGGARP